MRICAFIILCIIFSVLKYQSVDAGAFNTSLLEATEGYTFCVKKITPDSSSIFRAISFFLWGDENGHKQIRKNVADYVKQNYEEVGQLIMNEWFVLSWQEYYNIIIKDKTFATALERTFLTNIFKINLLVYESPSHGEKKLRKHCEVLMNPKYPVVTLFFYYGDYNKMYYNLLIKNEFFPIASLLKLNKNTYGVHAITRDGNCMFRAMSLIIWETESRHQQLRNEVTEYIKDNWDKYEEWVVAIWEISSAQKYFRYMNKDKMYASELECKVLAELYKLNLKIYREINRAELIKIVDMENKMNYKTARLLFSGETGSGHFEVLFKMNL